MRGRLKKGNETFDRIEKVIGVRPVVISDNFGQELKIKIGEFIWCKDLYWIQNLFTTSYNPYWEIEIRMLNFYYLNKFGKPYTDKWIETYIIPMTPYSPTLLPNPCQKTAKSFGISIEQNVIT